MRNIIDCNKDWLFAGQAATLEEALAKGGEPVTLPHTWNAVDGQDGSDYLQAQCWYVKKLGAPALGDGEELWVEFLAANQVADVYLNGQHLCHHEGGYTAFRANLTPALGGENLLAVSVDNRRSERIYPMSADFTFYGGLYREVSLLVVPAAHFALGYCGTPGIAVTPQVEGKDAKVAVQVYTEGPAKSVTVCVNGEEKTAPVADGTAVVEFCIENVHLWDGLHDPYLYTAQATLDSGDQVQTRFGCRTLGFDPDKGFFLNGKPYPLRGVAKHQDFLGVGNAVSHQQFQEDMAVIKELGATTLRLAHYPHHPYFYDLCDENGLVVWAEIPYISRNVPTGRQNTLDQMKDLLVQNYNHPSIVCWGLSNEIAMIGPMTDELVETHHLLNDLCHSLDKTRPTTMAHENTTPMDCALQEVPDISSYNLYFGWYKGDFPENGEFLDKFHAMHPNRCIGLSEYGADANFAYQSPKPEKGDYTESYQALYHEALLDIIEERPYLWATHVWNLFDFSAARRKDGGIPGRNLKGLVTMDRKIRKDAFYLYKSHWNPEPMVHLCGSRYVDRPEEVTEVKVYSNLPEVSLYVNGELAGTQQGKYIFRFQVPVAGEMEIVAKAGDLEDAIHIRKVDAPNPDYSAPEKETVLNWIDQDAFKKEFCAITDTLGSLLDNPAAHDRVQAFLDKVAPGLLDDKDMAGFFRGMAFDRLVDNNLQNLDKEEVQAFSQFLQNTPKQ